MEQLKNMKIFSQKQYHVKNFQINHQYSLNNEINKSRQRNGIVALIFRYWKTELLIALIALIVAALQYFGDERHFRNEQKLQQLQIFNDTVNKIVESKNTQSTSTANNIASLAARADNIIKQYPNDISSSDLLSIYSYTNLGFDPGRGFRWLNLAYQKSEEEIPKNIYDQILARWYLGTWYFYNSKNLNKAEILYDQAIEKIDKERSVRYKTLYMQIEFERASSYRDLGYINKCNDKINYLFEYIKKYPVYVDAKFFNDSVKNSNGCHKTSVEFTNNSPPISGDAALK